MNQVIPSPDFHVNTKGGNPYHGVTSGLIQLRYTAFCLLLGLVSAAYPTLALEREPYLQLLTDTSVVIVWRGNAPLTSCQVEYRHENASRWRESRSFSPVPPDQRGCEVAIDRLQPGAKYFYQVNGAEDRNRDPEAYYFVTAPRQGATTPFTAWVLGDSGRGPSGPRDCDRDGNNDSLPNENIITCQERVREAMLDVNGSNAPNLILHVGDIAYSNGTDAQFTSNHFAIYKNILRQTVLWPAPGNHEVGVDTASGGRFSERASRSGTLMPADNHAGYLVRFTDIEPGSDGEVTLTVAWAGTPGSAYRGKYASAVKLQENNGFAAYNDLAWAPGQLSDRITMYTSPNGNSGLPSEGRLKDYTNNGVDTSVSLQVTGGTFAGGIHARHGRTTPPGEGCSVFCNIVTTTGAISYINQESSPLILRFSGMNPNRTYTLEFYADRGNSEGSDYDWHRASWVNLSGASSSMTESTGPYYEAHVLPSAGEAGGVRSGTEAYYSFDYANTHFIVLDSMDSNRSPDSPMLQWLEADLANIDPNVTDWLIAYWHHPPYSQGSHDSDNPADSWCRMIDMRENVLPILEAGGVDLVIAGHSHAYERSYLIDGVYGREVYGSSGESDDEYKARVCRERIDTPGFEALRSGGHILDQGSGNGDAYHKPSHFPAHEGTVYVVAGHGGQTVSNSVSGKNPVMLVEETVNGSGLLDIDGMTLTYRNVSFNQVISDTFTIEKPQPNYTVNFDNLSEGDGVTDQYQADHGVLFSIANATAVPTIENASGDANNWFVRMTLPNVITGSGYVPGPGAGLRCDWDLQMDFDPPASAVQIRVFASVDVRSPVRIIAKDASGNEIARAVRMVSPGRFPESFDLRVTDAQARIATVVSDVLVERNPAADQYICTAFDNLVIERPRSSSGFTAYNDMLRTDATNNPNATDYGYDGMGGALIDIDTGAPLPVTMRGEIEGNPEVCDHAVASNGGNANAGTDADEVFGGIVNLQGMHELEAAECRGRITFDNLDPNKRYAVTLTANRNRRRYTNIRFTQVTIEGADTFSPASSPGALTDDGHIASFSTGYNTDNGYVAGWTNVTAADGTFSIVSAWHRSRGEEGGLNTQGYAMGAVKLEELP